MPLDAVSNFVRGSTDAAVDATQTTVSVADASIFPDPSVDGEFNVAIWDATNFPRPDQDSDAEIMRVTARDTTADDLTVARGQETTAGAAHPSGSAIHLSPTAKMFGDIEGTFADFWDASAQELTADVNNQTTTTTDSVTVTGGEAADTLHYGSNQDRANAGDNSVAVGIGARAPGDNGAGGTIGRHAAIGYQAAQNNTGFGVTASGYYAAQDNTGGGVTASGYQAARNNTGARVTASGYRAAQSNTGDRVHASGYYAAQSNTGESVTASGYLAARGDGLADPTTMGDDNIGIGASAIRNNQASGLIAIGQDAGINAQTDDQLIITQRNGTRRMVMDLTTGDLSISGTLTENATL